MATAFKWSRQKVRLLERAKELVETHGEGQVTEIGCKNAAMSLATSQTRHMAIKLVAQIAWIARLSDLPPSVQIFCTEVSQKLRRDLATVTIKKALPMSAAGAKRAMQHTKDPRERAALWLAWVTASRLSDICQLRQPQFQLVTRFLLIEFGTTKSNKHGRARQDHYVAIPRPPPLIRWAIQDWKPPTVKRLRAVLQSVPPRAPFLATTQRSARVELLSHFTGHSIKRGVAAIMYEWVAEKQMPAPLLPLMLKHKADRPIIPETTLAYASVPLHIAMSTETHIITAKLAMMIR
jgi:integrase